MMTLKEKCNKVPEIIFCLGSHMGCIISKTGKSWGWGGRKGLWSSRLRQPPGHGGESGGFQRAEARLCCQRNYSLRYSSN